MFSVTEDRSEAEDEDVADAEAVGEDDEEHAAASPPARASTADVPKVRRSIYRIKINLQK
jgi:hypothetical protein